MNSKWRANRIGLVDFWYYDEEEFKFLDGRMLLRGSNGSGKSVTMQSFIPVILDGNMRPNRLDPFGSTARKMENYLLEEDDGRDERTGYLYMEFKREDTDTYMTIGIGMRARRNKKMDVWYFGITDGRRIGRDFFLYKDVQNKIAYTKTELRNRIGDGGQVLDSQREYMEYVNRLLFGFETLDEYKEMLDLLIQLRTPKLSKDFKPTKINDILTSSLQTLSEDDLRPISEAIENMDSLKVNLDTLKESIKAGKQIQKVYDQYNKIVLYDKANSYEIALKEYDDCHKTALKLEETKLDCEEKLKKEQQCYDAIVQEEDVLTKERNSLNQSEATQLKEQEESYRKELHEWEKQKEEKEKQYNEKKERRIELENKVKEQEEKNDIYRDEIQEKLEEMEEYIEDIPFDEFEFFKQELLGNLDQSYDFESHKKLLQTYQKNVEDGVEILEKEKKYQEQYSDSLQKYDEIQKERDDIERTLKQYEILLHETKAEFIENLYRWERGNQQLKIPQNSIQEITRIVEAWQQGDEYSNLETIIRKYLHEKEDELREELREIQAEEKEMVSSLHKKKEELTKWENAKDPEPERKKEVEENRKRLKEKGIPYTPFYKVIEFADSLKEEQASRLEEALLRMGILDALIVPLEYREQVLALEDGVCDTYFFHDVNSVKENLLHALDVAQEEDILLSQTILNILRGIGYQNEIGESHTWIDEKGNYRIGVLEGTITKQYEAKYIGVQARERYRKQQIEYLKVECDELQKAVEEIQEKVRQKEDEFSLLKQEYNEFPSGEDIKTAVDDYKEKERDYNRIGQEIEKSRILLEQQRQELERVRVEVQSICSKTDLSVQLVVFEAARKDLREYSELLGQVQIVYNNYRNGLDNQKSQREYLEEVHIDIDDILSEINRSNRKLSGIKQMIESIQKQLALTDYKMIEERLDFCIKRLATIPKERENCVKNSTELEERIKNLEEKQEENKRLEEEIRVKKEQSRIAFEEEKDLGYVELGFIKEQSLEESAKKISKMFYEDCKGKTKSDLSQSVQTAYYQWRGALSEYSLTLIHLFDQDTEGQDNSNRKRIDLRGKYRGSQIVFRELIQRLEADIEEQSRLLSDKDRELFQEVLANTISKKIRARIQASKRWVDRMNELMESMKTSSGLKLNLRWKNRRAEKEGQMDTKVLVDLLQKDSEIMRPEEIERLSKHFRSKIEEARKLSEEQSDLQSFHMIMKEVLDYRKWFEFQLESQKTGEKKKELTDRVFFTFSGGEKAMAMYVPLFSAVAAKYAAARKDAPKLISLDEAFAGVDEMNIKDMFRLMVEFEFDFMLNSQILWGDYETVPSIAIYQLVRPENAKCVGVISYVWNGIVRTLVERIGDESAES